MGVSRYRSSKKERLRQGLRIFFTFIFSHVGLCALVVAYATVGALIFPFLESERELQQRKDMESYRQHYLWQIWNATDQLQLTFDIWSSAVRPLLKEFEGQVVKAAKIDGFDGKEVEDMERQWSFSGGLLYSFTVITTIGYGNLVPKTDVGKVFTMLYALIGIPLMLLFISNLGTLMASSFRFAFTKLCCSWSLKCCPSSAQHPAKPTSKPPSPSIIGFNTDKPPLFIKPSTGSTDIDKEGDVVSDAVVKDPHTLHIRDSELFEHDYDVIPEGSSSPVSDLSDEKWKQAMTHLYAMDRLDADAKFVLVECAKYGTEQSRVNPPIQQKWEQAIQIASLERSKVTNTNWSFRGLSQTSKSKYNPDGAPLVLSKPRRPPEPRVPVILVFAFLIGYICVGAVVFSYWEEWSYLDGAYFSFVTLSTIGFGDLVPGARVLNAETRQLIACIVYLVVGLAIIAMSFNLVQEEVVSRFQKLGQNLGILDEK